MVVSIIVSMFLIVAFTAGAQTQAVGTWIAESDSDEGGKSTLTMATATETIGGRQVTTYTFTGAVQSGGSIEWPWVQAAFKPNAATETALKSSTGVRFKIVGDGRPLLFSVYQSTVTDYGYHRVEVTTRRDTEREVTIRWSQLRQPDWAVRKTFDIKNLPAGEDAFNLAVDGVRPNISFKIYDVEILQ